MQLTPDQFWWDNGNPPGASHKFTREKNGYKPEEVDTVIDTLLRENSGLSDENARLRKTLAACEPKLRQLAQTAEAMEREWETKRSVEADSKTDGGLIAKRKLNQEVINEERT